MAFDAKLAERIRDRLAAHSGVTDKRMFGGLAFLINGNMAVCVGGDDLMVRVGKDGMEQALARPGARPSVMGKRTMAGWVVVDGAHLDDEALTAWIGRATDFVRTMPPK